VKCWRNGANFCIDLDRHRKLLSVAAAIIICLGTAAAFAQSAAVGLKCPPDNLGLYKLELIYYVDSGQYERGLANVASGAATWLRARARRKGRLAMVLDIDETSLSNWPVIKQDDFGVILHGPCDTTPQACGWNAWIRMARDKPIVPTLELYREARRLGVAVFFITGRHESLREATERNLKAAGYDGWTGLVMEPEGLHPNAEADFKAPARRNIVDQGYTIVVNMGDQDSDLEHGYAERKFKLPDPFYYIP
jgi:predicted secreted acid phosphatase